MLPIDQQILSCNVQVHKTILLLNITSDKNPQSIVYELFPGLFKIKIRRDLYASLSSAVAANGSNENREVADEDKRIITDDETISLSIGFFFFLPEQEVNKDKEKFKEEVNDKSYLQCPARMTVMNLRNIPYISR